jgi:GNAT superfamily N-acetyltransferase
MIGTLSIGADAMEIVQVVTRRDERDFVELPYTLYTDYPHWVAPLRSEQRKLLSAEANPMLAHCDVALYLLRHEGKVIGRIAAFVDQVAIDFWKDSIGFWGSYECIDDADASRMLFDAARAFLAERGMRRMRGPINFTVVEWGFVIEGFDRPPSIMSPYNPPYYNQQAEAYGLEKAKDLVAFEADLGAGYTMPDRFSRSMERIAKRYKVRVRPLDMENLERDMIYIVDIMNGSVAHNWGSYPVTEAEGRAIVADLKQIVDPEFVLIAEVEGEPIGFSITLPDINRLLHGGNGRLLPTNLFRLLFGLKKLRHFRTWALGLFPAYHGKGIDSLLYYRTYQIAQLRQAHVEVNYVLEDNIKMLAPLFKMGIDRTKTFRVYEMDVGGSQGS